MDNFDRAFEILCELEGFTSNDSDDPGGLTIYGISSKFYPAIVEQMQNSTPEEAKEIAKDFYFSHFWNPLNCTSLPYPLDIIAFVQGVNAPGPTRSYLTRTSDYKAFLLNFAQYYYSLTFKNPSLNKFFKGWIGRLCRLWSMFKEEQA